MIWRKRLIHNKNNFDSLAAGLYDTYRPTFSFLPVRPCIGSNKGMFIDDDAVISSFHTLHHCIWGSFCVGLDSRSCLFWRNFLSPITLLVLLEIPLLD